MTTLIRPVILCGGAGTRLWPASRSSLPKQFLKLVGSQSTLQDTIERVSDPSLFGMPLVVTHRDYRFLVQEQIEEVGRKAEIVLEPARRDSGPAVAAAARVAGRDDPEALVLVLAADHVVRDPGLFVAAVRMARPAAQSGRIVTFGMKPHFAASGYGYIRPGSMIPEAEPVRMLEAFIEKPDADTAQAYSRAGYLWNSGNFLFRADVFLTEYAEFEPEAAAAVAEAVAHATSDLGFLLLDREAFVRAARKSVDYAVMEKTRRAAVLPADYGWSDLGGWNAVWQETRRDADGNATRGDVVVIDSKNSYASGEILTALVGVENMLVVVTGDAVLVASRDRADDLRELVDELSARKRTEAVAHSRIHRPWGSYQLVDRGERFQVKRIVVKPHGRLSLQKHALRAEHWVVVRGTARITIGDETKTLQANQSAYIPIGAVHRLENPGSEPLELIEVQTGVYLGEDDIVRIEDDYRRDLTD